MKEKESNIQKVSAADQRCEKQQAANPPEEEFEFRMIRSEETGQVVEIERICFPPHEACSEAHMRERIETAPEWFLVAVDKKSGKIAGFLNGLATCESVFRDAFFVDAGLHDPKGQTVMLLGLAVLPEYRRQGLATEIVARYMKMLAERKVQRALLTCLECRVGMYENMGFQDKGISGSSWGKEIWHEMIYCLEQKDIGQRENPACPRGTEGEKMLLRMNESHEPLRSFGLPFVDWKKEMRILDAGCGGGATIADMLKLSPGSVIDGIDYSEVSVQQSLQLNQEYIGTRCHIQKADVVCLPFAEGQFDLVTAVETVYFWPDITAGLREVYRVLKPGGTFAILNEGCDPDQNDWPPIDGFMRIYRPEELEELLMTCGFARAESHRGSGQLLCVIGRK